MDCRMQGLPLFCGQWQQIFKNQLMTKAHFCQKHPSLICKLSIFWMDNSQPQEATEKLQSSKHPFGNRYPRYPTDLQTSRFTRSIPTVWPNLLFRNRLSGAFFHFHIQTLGDHACQHLKTTDIQNKSYQFNDCQWLRAQMLHKATSGVGRRGFSGSYDIYDMLTCHWHLWTAVFIQFFHICSLQSGRSTTALLFATP